MGNGTAVGKQLGFMQIKHSGKMFVHLLKDANCAVKLCRAMYRITASRVVNIYSLALCPWIESDRNRNSTNVGRVQVWTRRVAVADKD